jgi:hypothetical protein
MQECLIHAHPTIFVCQRIILLNITKRLYNMNLFIYINAAMIRRGELSFIIKAGFL